MHYTTWTCYSEKSGESVFSLRFDLKTSCHCWCFLGTFDLAPVVLSVKLSRSSDYMEDLNLHVETSLHQVFCICPHLSVECAGCVNGTSGPNFSGKSIYAKQARPIASMEALHSWLRPFVDLGHWVQNALLVMPVTHFSVTALLCVYGFEELCTGRLYFDNIVMHVFVHFYGIFTRVACRETMVLPPVILHDWPASDCNHPTVLEYPNILKNVWHIVSKF